MASSPSHAQAHDHPPQAGRNLAAAFWLNLGFTLFELLGGWWTNSVAILSDAVHDLGDSVSLGAAWYLQRRAQQGRDAQYSFGYRRFALLGALLNGAILVIGSVLIVQEALPRLWAPDAAHAPGMMLLAVGGVLINGLAVWRLQGGHSLQERAVRLHLLEDVGGWLAVLLGGALMYITGWAWIDPCLSLGIAGWVLVNAVRTLRDVLRILLQAVPSDRDMAALRQDLLAVEGVADLHDLHLWSLDGAYEILSVHLKTHAVQDLTEVAAIKQAVRQRLADLGIEHATLEVEHPGESCALADSSV